MCRSSPPQTGTFKRLTSQGIGPSSLSFSLSLSTFHVLEHTYQNECKLKIQMHTHLCIHTTCTPRNTQPGTHIPIHLHAHRYTWTHKPATYKYAAWVAHSLAHACSICNHRHTHTATHVRITGPGAHPPPCRERALPLASGPGRQPSGAICQAEVPAPPILPELRRWVCQACSLAILSG